MNQGFGHEVPGQHVQSMHRTSARYLVVLPTAGVAVARLFLGNREQVAEFDANTEEATSMTKGLLATKGAVGPEWDRALAGHSAEERAAADVYTLAV